MQNVLNLYKPIGLTPLQTIDKLKKAFPEYQNAKLSYAGRLDPMAQGLLLVLVNQENQKRHTYENLHKTYEADLLLGLQTDTNDTLGLVSKVKPQPKIQKDQILKVIRQLKGQQIQYYPAYSSKPVNKKPLYYWARTNQLDKITIPSKNIEIFQADFITQYSTNTSKLTQKVIQNIQKVNGNFRQADIISNWEKFASDYPGLTWPVIKIRITCSSGTYIRKLADSMGHDLNTFAIALSITRTRIGDYSNENAIYI